MQSRSLVVRVSWVAALFFFVVFGVWPFVAPHSFYVSLATFPPFNTHLMRDIGAFTLGIGIGLLAAFRWADALLVVLSTAAAASVLHVASHLIDRNRGGHPVSDIALLGVLAALLIVGAVVRARELRTAG